MLTVQRPYFWNSQSLLSKGHTWVKSKNQAQSLKTCLALEIVFKMTSEREYNVKSYTYYVLSNTAALRTGQKTDVFWKRQYWESHVIVTHTKPIWGGVSGGIGGFDCNHETPTWRVLSQREMQWKWKAWLHTPHATVHSWKGQGWIKFVQISGSNGSEKSQVQKPLRQLPVKLTSLVWLAWLAWHSMHRSMIWLRQIAQLSTTMSHAHRATAFHFLTKKRGIEHSY